MLVLKNKTVLIISPEFWGRSYLSKHHYAECLAERGNKVFFLDPPGVSKSADALAAEARYPGRLHIIPDKGQRGLRFLPDSAARWVMRRQLRAIERRYGVRFDLVWSFDNSRYYLLDALPGTFSIHHLVDLEVDFNMAKACRTADLCLAVTHTIMHRMASYNKRAFFLQHGYRPLAKTEARLPQGRGKLKAAYIGNLLMANFDMALFRRLAEENPATDFYLIGSYGFGNLNLRVDFERARLISELQTLPNIYLLGERTPADTYTMVDEADILLLMYFNYHRKVDNSSKLPPYLASGKVILSDRVTEYEHTGLLEMTDSREAFLARFNAICADIEAYNSPEKQQRRIAYAHAHRYAQQLDKIEDIVQRSLQT